MTFGAEAGGRAASLGQPEQGDGDEDRDDHADNGDEEGRDNKEDKDNEEGKDDDGGPELLSLSQWPPGVCSPGLAGLQPAPGQ